MKRKMSIKKEMIGKLMQKQIMHVIKKDVKLDEDNVQLFKDMNNMVKRIQNNEAAIE